MNNEENPPLKFTQLMKLMQTGRHEDVENQLMKVINSRYKENSSEMIFHLNNNKQQQKQEDPK